MLALIKREIEDNLIFFVIAAVTATVVVSIIIWSVVPVGKSELPIGISWIMYGALWWLLPFLPLACAALGATQMYADRDKKVSAFLSTLTTTRGQILTAKIITGLLWILVVLLPIAVTDAVLLKVFPGVVPVGFSLLVKTFIITFLSALACYAVGLQMGWNTNKFFPILGSITISPVLLLVIIIKGFGIETTAILLLFTVVLMVRIRQKFMSTAL